MSCGSGRACRVVVQMVHRASQPPQERNLERGCPWWSPWSWLKVMSYWLGTQGDEFLVMGLRLHEGIDMARYQALSAAAIDPRRVEGETCSPHKMSRAPAPRTAGSNSEERCAPHGMAPCAVAVVADLASRNNPKAIGLTLFPDFCVTRPSSNTR